VKPKPCVLGVPDGQVGGAVLIAVTQRIQDEMEGYSTDSAGRWYGWSSLITMRATIASRIENARIATPLVAWEEKSRPSPPMKAITSRKYAPAEWEPSARRASHLECSPVPSAL
jgi:hypothetical protein